MVKGNNTVTKLGRYIIYRWAPTSLLLTAANMALIAGIFVLFVP